MLFSYDTGLQFTSIGFFEATMKIFQTLYNNIDTNISLMSP